MTTAIKQNYTNDTYKALYKRKYEITHPLIQGQRKILLRPKLVPQGKQDIGDQAEDVGP